MNNSLQPKQIKFTSFMSQEGTKKLVKNALGELNAQRFMSSIISAVTTNPALEECTHKSILSGALLGESLKLSPSPQLGQYYLVPFKKKDKQGNVVEINAQFILGAKGYKQLAMRTGQYADIDVISIKEGEYRGRDRFTGKQTFQFVEDDDVRDKLPTVGYMAYFELLNGFRKQIYWTKQKMIDHADRYSSAFDASKYDDFINGRIPQKDLWKYSSYWYADFEGMAHKTLIRQLISQWGIMSIEMVTAYERDNAVINENGDAEYVENESIVKPSNSIQEQPQQEQLDQNVTAEEQEEFDFFNEDAEE